MFLQHMYRVSFFHAAELAVYFNNVASVDGKGDFIAVFKRVEYTH